MAHCYACLSEISDWASRCPYCTAEVSFAGACPSHHLTDSQMNLRVFLTVVVVWTVVGCILVGQDPGMLHSLGEIMLWPWQILAELWTWIARG
jgi:hypothetical protein